MKMKYFSHAFLLLLLVVVNTGCGYRFRDASMPWVGSTISVPYVLDDMTGDFTQALVREVASSGAFEYVDQDACYCLCVKVCTLCDENVGFRYDINKQGELTNTVIPVETRTRVVASFSLIEACSGRVVMGPERVLASVDFDHEFEGGSENLSLFSLGQLTDLEVAKESVPRRLGCVLAKRIVDYLHYAW